MEAGSTVAFLIKMESETALSTVVVSVCATGLIQFNNLQSQVAGVIVKVNELKRVG